MKNIAYVLLIAAMLSVLGIQNIKADCADIDTVTFFCEKNGKRDEIFQYWIGSSSDGTPHLQKVNCKAKFLIDCVPMDDATNTGRREKVRDWANSSDMKEKVNTRCKGRNQEYRGQWRAHPRSDGPQSVSACSFGQTR